MVKFQLEGINDALKLLESLGETMTEKVLFDVNKAAAQIVKKQLEQDTPEGNNDKANSDKAAKQVTITKNTHQRSGVSIGYKRKAFYLKFYEKGTKVRATKGKGKYKKKANRGSISAHPFVLQAHQNAAPEVIKFFNSNFQKVVNKSLKKHIKKYSKNRR